ncbi:MAG: A/G-specific adenine glycosylase [Candidatus Dormibacteria bacterium]
MASREFANWYQSCGRHHLPWRRTHDPWAVVVSEVMLQQTSVARVLPRWERFLRRWPDPQACAAASLEEVLREWQGLGYPRRARALHRTAGVVASAGWPDTEAGLRSLPGVGPYTAGALAHLAFGWDGRVPQDVNIARVTARAVLGTEVGGSTPGQRARGLDDLDWGLSGRSLVLALFDLGATVCTARRPLCRACPLRPRCASADRLTTALPRPPARRQATWRGSLRELRGAVLREFLGGAPPTSYRELHGRVGHLGAAGSGDGVGTALDGLVRDGLLPAPGW